MCRCLARFARPERSRAVRFGVRCAGRRRDRARAGRVRRRQGRASRMSTAFSYGSIRCARQDAARDRRAPPRARARRRVDRSHPDVIAKLGVTEARGTSAGVPMWRCIAARPSCAVRFRRASSMARGFSSRIAATAGRASGRSNERVRPAGVVVMEACPELRRGRRPSRRFSTAPRRRSSTARSSTRHFCHPRRRECPACPRLDAPELTTPRRLTEGEWLQDAMKRSRSRAPRAAVPLGCRARW